MCQLCGCWYETRKGLASHARSHLRQIGVADSEIKGSPIELLYRIMEEEDLKPISSEEQSDSALKSLTGSSSKRPPSLSSSPVSPPPKKPKTSEDCVCVLCGEEFENRKGLGSHSRSHLNQLGVLDPLGKASPIDTIQELVNSGVLEAAHRPKTNAHSSSAAPSPAPAALSPTPGQSQAPFSSTALSQSTAKNTSQFPVSKAPKAKKGFRLAVDPLHRKPKPEPVETEVSGQPDGSRDSSNSLIQKPPDAAVGTKPLSTGKPMRYIECWTS